MTSLSQRDSREYVPLAFRQPINTTQSVNRKKKNSELVSPLSLLNSARLTHTAHAPGAVTSSPEYHRLTGKPSPVISRRIPEKTVPGHRLESCRSGKSLRVLPFFLALLTIFVLLAGGMFDTFILQGNSGLEPHFPGDTAPRIPVLKASVELPSESRSAPDLIHTSHKVGRTDTISRLAFKYGLSPSTLISANRLSGAKSIKTGDILVIPYTDGARVTLKNGETLFELAERLGVSFNTIHRFPDSSDLFIPGYKSETADFSENKSSGSARFHYPVEGRVITAYGEGLDTLTGIPYASDGIDLSAAAGTEVKAARNGTVILTGSHSSYGLYVMVAHSGGWKSFYGYLSRIDVAPGDTVSAGTVIARVGDSGTARSPRLHFVLFEGKRSVDPLDYLY